MDAPDFDQARLMLRFLGEGVERTLAEFYRAPTLERLAYLHGSVADLSAGMAVMEAALHAHGEGHGRQAME